MHMSLAALILAVLLASVSAYCTRRYILGSPQMLVRHAKADLACYLLSYAGLISLLPETMAVFAPELVSPQSIAGTLWERLDYATFVLLSIAAGINLMRRWLLIQYQKQQARWSLAPPPRLEAE